MIRCFYLMLVVFPVLCGSCLADKSPELMRLVRDARSSDVLHQIPDPRQLKAAETLFRESLRGSRTFVEFGRRWEKLGFELLEVALDQRDRIWVIREQPGRQSGRGIYAIRPASQSHLVIQAPHGFFDRHTREIAVHLAADPHVAAAAWNTIHRSKVDVAHVEHHYFNAFTRAMTQHLNPALVVQLHGFSQKARTSMAGRNAAFIISNGSHSPSNLTFRVARELQSAFPDSFVRLYPWEIRELGATTNIQAAVVRSASDEFLSIEMSTPRQQLMQSARHRTEFLKAVLGRTEFGS